VANDTLTTARVADGEDVLGSHQRLTTWDTTLSDSYVTGGYTITPQRFGLKVVRAVLVGEVNTAALGYTVQYVSSTGKLAVLTGAMAQPAGNTDLSTLTLRLLFIGE